jgi:hypothetical protein
MIEVRLSSADGGLAMFRRVMVLALAAAMVSATVGCRHNCGGNGWFTSRASCEPPCSLASRPADPCYPGTPVSLGGGPGVVPEGTLVPGAGVPLMPGPAGPAPELPYPQPTDLIPRPGVPVPSAVPTPAPGEMGTNILPAPKAGVPVKGLK